MVDKCGDLSGVLTQAEDDYFMSTPLVASRIGNANGFAKPRAAKLRYST